jgi:hypothetical protein
MNTAEKIVRICAKLGLLGEASALIRDDKSVEDARLLVARERAYRRLRRKRQSGWARPD